MTDNSRQVTDSIVAQLPALPRRASFEDIISAAIEAFGPNSGEGKVLGEFLAWVKTTANQRVGDMFRSLNSINALSKDQYKDIYNRIVALKCKEGKAAAFEDIINEAIKEFGSNSGEGKVLGEFLAWVKTTANQRVGDMFRSLNSINPKSKEKYKDIYRKKVEEACRYKTSSPIYVDTVSPGNFAAGSRNETITLTGNLPEDPVVEILFEDLEPDTGITVSDCTTIEGKNQTSCIIKEIPPDATGTRAVKIYSQKGEGVPFIFNRAFEITTSQVTAAAIRKGKKNEIVAESANLVSEVTPFLSTADKGQKVQLVIWGTNLERAKSIKQLEGSPIFAETAGIERAQIDLNSDTNIFSCTRSAGDINCDSGNNYIIKKDLYVTETDSPFLETTEFQLYDAYDQPIANTRVRIAYEKQEVLSGYDPSNFAKNYEPELSLSTTLSPFRGRKVHLLGRAAEDQIKANYFGIDAKINVPVIVSYADDMVEKDKFQLRIPVRGAFGQNIHGGGKEDALNGEISGGLLFRNAGIEGLDLFSQYTYKNYTQPFSEKPFFDPFFYSGTSHQIKSGISWELETDDYSLNFSGSHTADFNAFKKETGYNFSGTNTFAGLSSEFKYNFTSKLTLGLSAFSLIGRRYLPQAKGNFSLPNEYEPIRGGGGELDFHYSCFSLLFGYSGGDATLRSLYAEPGLSSKMAGDFSVKIGKYGIAPGSEKSEYSLRYAFPVRWGNRWFNPQAISLTAGMQDFSTDELGNRQSGFIRLETDIYKLFFPGSPQYDYK